MKLPALALTALLAFPGLAYAQCPDPTQTGAELVHQAKSEDNVTLYVLNDPDAIKAFSQMSVIMGGQPLPEATGEVIFKPFDKDPGEGSREVAAFFTDKDCLIGFGEAPADMLYSLQQTEDKKQAAPKS